VNIMAISGFEEFCRSFCELAGIRVPALAPDAEGLWAATVRMRGVSATLMHHEQHSPGSVCLVAELGAMPEHEALAGWQALMQANLCMTGHDGPVYSRHPTTGAALLQWACPLARATATGVVERVTALVDVVTQWRDGRFTADPDAACATIGW
jgi:hypothetical protein